MTGPNKINWPLMRPKPRSHSSHPTQQNTTLTLQINNTILPTNKEPKILGLTLDPKLNYSKHIQNTTQKAKQTIHIMKALTTTHWGKFKETLNITYKTIVNPILEYASTIWSPIISNTNTNKLLTKLSTPNNNRMHTRHKCTPPAHRNKNSPHRHTHEIPWITITTTSTRPWTHAAPAHHARTTSKTQKTNNLPQQKLHNWHRHATRHYNTKNYKSQHRTNTHSDCSKLHANNSSQQSTEQNTTRNKQHRTSTPTLYKKTSSTTPHKQITNPTRIPTQNHPRNTPNIELSPMQRTTTRHTTHIWLPEVADGPGPWGAVERSRGGGGATGPLVGSGGMGPGAGMRGGGRVGPPWGRQQQQQTHFVR